MKRDERSRNAYKRYWRNKKNWERRLERAVDLKMASQRSFRLMTEAHREMELENK